MRISQEFVYGYDGIRPVAVPSKHSVTLNETIKLINQGLERLTMVLLDCTSVLQEIFYGPKVFDGTQFMFPSQTILWADRQLD